MRQALDRSSSQFVLHRFVIMLALLLLITAVQVLLEYGSAFFDLVPLFVWMCVAIAVILKERPFDTNLNHWDEAWGFVLLTCLG